MSLFYNFHPQDQLCKAVLLKSQLIKSLVRTTYFYPHTNNLLTVTKSGSEGLPFKSFKWVESHFVLRSLWVTCVQMNSSGTQNLITVHVSESIRLRSRSKCAYFFSLVAQMCQNKENLLFGLHKKCSALQFLAFMSITHVIRFGVFLKKEKVLRNNKKYSLWWGCVRLDL